jgi:hypothetical protein
MKAETAYNVIQALPKSEYERLKGMLGLTKAEKKPKRKPLLSKAEATEYVLRMMK